MDFDPIKSELMTTVKQFTIIPIEACKYFKPKDLYLLAGLYINAPYKEREEYLVTNTTYEQLSGTTGVSLDYIKDPGTLACGLEPE